MLRVLVFRVFIWRSQGRIAADYLPALQVCPFRVLVSTDWSAPGQGVTAPESVQLARMSAMALLVWFCCFSVQELKHN